MTETEKVELAIKHLNGHSVEANTVLMLKCIASSLAKIADNMEDSKEKEEGNLSSFKFDNRWGLYD